MNSTLTRENLRAWRDQNKLSAAAFARLVGVSGGRTVRLWEAGDRAVPGTVATIVNLLEACPRTMRDRVLTEARAGTIA